MQNAEKKQLTFEMTEDEDHSMNNEHGGFCLSCGEEAFGVEPDARKYECEFCEEKEVYGLEEIMVMGLVEIS